MNTRFAGSNQDLHSLVAGSLAQSGVGRCSCGALVGAIAGGIPAVMMMRDRSVAQQQPAG